MVMAPVVRGRKGEYGKLLEQMRLEGYSRAKVNGELRRLDEEIVLDKKYKHDISIVVDRLVMKTDLRRRLSESVEAAAGLAGGPGRSRDRRRRGGRDAALLRAVRLPQLRHLDPRAGAADLLLQLAPRRLRALPRARLPAGDRPRAGRPRPDPLARRGRPAAVEPRYHRLLEAADRRGRRGVRRRRRQALVEAEEVRAGDLPLRHRRRAPPGHLHQPLRPPPLLQGPLRGDRQQPAAPLRGDRLGDQPRADRGLHGRAAVPRSARAPGCGRRASRSRSAGSASPSTATSRRGRRPSGSPRWR